MHTKNCPVANLPIMPLNIESDSEGGNIIIGRILARILEKAEGIEQKPLTDFIA